ncbi:MAG: hypothetical protein BECKG1743D_GA0114223_112322, partial [Candidatus Kentron sp. G]
LLSQAQDSSLTHSTLQLRATMSAIRHPCLIMGQCPSNFEGRNTNPDPQTDLVGRVLPARIKKVRLDSCDLDLLDGEGGSEIAQGRLYQAESLAWRDARLLKDIPDYQPNDILDAVYVRRPRHEEGQELWYVNERWGRHNPWEGLELQEGDIVTGIVIRSIVSTRSGEHAGYLVQLAVGAPIWIDGV